MRKLTSLIAAGFLAATILGACSKQPAETQESTQSAAPTRPAADAGQDAWGNYFKYLVGQNLDGMTANSPYLYYVPSGDSPEAESQRLRLLGMVQGTVARTVLAGNLLAFAGPDSATTADFLIHSFEHAKEGSFKGVIVLFVGEPTDKERVAAALKSSQATLRFVAM